VRDIDMDGIHAHYIQDVLMFDVPPPLQSKGMGAH
jgi:ketosteroid isomerase-like protein